MPRLSVRKDLNSEDAAPLTVKVSWAAFFVFLALGVVWFLGLGVLDDWLRLDLTCSGERYYTRQAQVSEAVSCAIAEGPRGWLYLGWSASWPLLVFWSLERGLRRAIKARGVASRSGAKREG